MTKLHSSDTLLLCSRTWL